MTPEWLEWPYIRGQLDGRAYPGIRSVLQREPYYRQGKGTCKKKVKVTKGASTLTTP